MYKLLSFDLYGTLVNTPPTNAKAFRIILEEAGAPNIDALAFYQFWESRNIVQSYAGDWVTRLIRRRGEPAIL